MISEGAALSIFRKTSRITPMAVSELPLRMLCSIKARSTYGYTKPSSCCRSFRNRKSRAWEVSIFH